MKGNNNLAVICCAENLGRKVKRADPAVYGRIKGIFPPGTDIFSAELYDGLNTYNLMTPDQRYAFVRRLDTAAYRFLETLARSFP